MPPRALFKQLEAKANALPGVLQAIPFKALIGYGVAIGVWAPNPEDLQGEIRRIRSGLGMKGQSWQGIPVKFVSVKRAKDREEMEDAGGSVYRDDMYAGSVWDVRVQDGHIVAIRGGTSASNPTAPYWPSRIAGHEVSYEYETYGEESEGTSARVPLWTPLFVVSLLTAGIAGVGVVWKEMEPR